MMEKDNKNKDSIADSSRAYVTLVNDPGYVPGAKVLARSLQATSTKIPLLMMVNGLSKADIRDLERQEAVIREVPSYAVETQARKNFPNRSKTFAKVHAWLLTEFEKCVFLDSDIVVESNIDRLFDYSEFSAVGSPDYFNTGVFVFSPSVETYQNLIQAAEAVADDDTYIDDSEQELFHRFFRSQFKSLPKGYNFRPYHKANLIRHRLQKSSWLRQLFRNIGHPNAIYLIHFIGYPKPWEHLLPNHDRDPRHYTWTEKQISRAEWSFQVWLKYWT